MPTENGSATPQSRPSGWEIWHEWYARIHQPITAWSCEAIRAKTGQVVLDAACGIGVPSLAIAKFVGPQGKVVAIDTSAEMLAGARRKAREAGLENIEHREMNIAALEFTDASFDASTCSFGLMFCPDPVKGASELFRVLKPGGRFAITVWDEPAGNPFFTTIFDSLARFLPVPAPSPDAPGPFRIGSAGELERVLRSAGFGEFRIERREVMFEFDSLAMHWQVVTDLVGPLRAAVAKLPDDEIVRLKEAIADALAPYLDSGRVRVPNTALCASGAQ